MQSLRLLPEEKANVKFRSHKRKTGGNAFSFLVRDAAKDYHGKKMKSLNYLDRVNIKSEEW